MSNLMRPARPAAGQQTTREIRVQICSGCGYAMDDTGLCSDHCDLDGEHHNTGDSFTAVYTRTDVFLRDEIPEAAL
jgi:hypothetical protein